MRGYTAKRLRKLARRECPNQGSVLTYNEFGTAKYDGLVRKYRDLKAEWKNSNIFQKEVFFK